jgi:hypothetical protein
MAVVVQKSSGTLSALIAANEFYQTTYEANLFACNSGGANVGICQLDTATRYINWTPAASGNFLGVLLAVYCAGEATIAGSLKVELQEDSGGWVTRATRSRNLSRWIPDDEYCRIDGIIDVRFTSTYAITTAPNTWRLAISLTGYSGPAFYLRFSQNGASEDELFFVPYNDTTVTLSASDTLILTDRVEVDQNWTFPAKNVATGTQSGLDVTNKYMSVWTCSPIQTAGSETYPQLYVPPSVSADYLVQCEGSIFVSSYGTPLLVGDSASSPIPSSRKFELRFVGTAADKSPGFITTQTTRYGRAAFLKAYGTRPQVEVAERTAAIPQGTKIMIVSGDVTSAWSIGDRLMLAGAHNVGPFSDYNKLEMRTVAGTSYNAGPDETTVTLDANVSYDYTLETEVSNPVVYCERNVVIGGEAGGVAAQRSRFICRSVTIDFIGVEIGNLYDFDVGYTYTVDCPQGEWTGLETSLKGCVLNDCFFGFRPYAVGGGIDIQDTHTVSAAAIGASVSAYGIYIRQCKSNSCSISGCVMLARHTSGAYRLENSKNIVIDSSYTMALTGLYSVGVNAVEVKNSEFFRSGTGLSYSTFNVNIVQRDNVFREFYYNPLMASGYCLNMYSDNDSYSEMNNYMFAIQPNSLVQAVFDRPTVVNYDLEIIETANRATWVASTFIGLQHLNAVDGQCISVDPNGDFDSTGWGLSDTTAYTYESGAIAWRQRKAWDNTTHVKTLHVPVNHVNVGTIVTVAIKCKLGSTNYGAGVHEPPTLRLTGLGVDGQPSTVSQHAVTGTDWRTLKVSGQPDRRGMMTLSMEILTDASAVDSSVYWDDVAISYNIPPRFGDMNTPVDAGPLDPPVNTYASAKEIWAELLSANQVPGSFGEWVQNLLHLATRDAILDDATKFSGANIDAAISSRATQAQILSDATPFDGAKVDATISSRAQQSDILSDATPFDGAKIDATISSRATQAQILSDATPFSGAAIDTISTKIDALAELSKIGNALGKDNVVYEDIQKNHSHAGIDYVTDATGYAYDSAANATAHDKATGLLYTFTFEASYVPDSDDIDWWRMTRA